MPGRVPWFVAELVAVFREITTRSVFAVVVGVIRGPLVGPVAGEVGVRCIVRGGVFPED